jgi:hypothetical protein
MLMACGKATKHGSVKESVICIQVNVPKQKTAFCKGKTCLKHQVHKVTQYKTGKASLFAQGAYIFPLIICVAGYCSLFWRHCLLLQPSRLWGRDTRAPSLYYDLVVNMSFSSLKMSSTSWSSCMVPPATRHALGTSGTQARSQEPLERDTLRDTALGLHLVCSAVSGPGWVSLGCPAALGMGESFFSMLLT